MMRVVISLFFILYASMAVQAKANNDQMLRRCWRLSTGVSGFSVHTYNCPLRIIGKKIGGFENQFFEFLILDS